MKIIILILALWTLPWKAYSLWMAVKHDHKKWFIVLVIVNTFAILEIYYIFKVLKKSWAEVKKDFKNAWVAIQ